ncbi:hypothetical protein [Streptomyces sp. NPDC047028]|uniref:hypothetical protein n=1 Tax=Streptomyces sp. NPDC047028 TaxID=3155793 RepID=UPI0033E9E675
MWPGDQPPAGGQQQNPYLQPGYQQAGPYGDRQPPATWPQPGSGAPTPAPGGGGGRTKVIAVVAAAAVVVAAGVTGFVLLGGKGDDQAGPGPTATASASTSASASPKTSASGNPRGGDSGPKPTIAGWKTVVNADTDIAFDVPPTWQVRSKDWITYVTDDSAPGEKILVGMKAPAVLQDKWCATDADMDGTTDYTPLANTGTRGNAKAKSPAQAARDDSANWVYGDYAQPDRKKVTTGPVTSYTTASGITGSVVTSQSSGVVKKNKCTTDGKATTFAFRDPDGALLSWSFVGVKGVSDEVPDATVREIMRTVRLYDPPAG